jgi:signal transduction histidine kinase
VSLPLGRTGVAAVLCGVALGLPCVAWWVSGSRAARLEAAEVARAPVAQARREAEHLAQSLALRLEALRQSESRRSLYDYQVREADADCADGRLLVVSPLAEGPADPLIWAHFQVDEVGQLTLPTLTHGSAARDDAQHSIQLAIVDELECARVLDRTAADGMSDPTEQRRVLTGGGIVTVGAFRWHTVTIRERPALVSVRQVSTDSALLTQGFVVLAQSLEPLVAGSTYPMTLRPGETGGESAATLRLDDQPWTLAADPSAALEPARAAAAEVLRDFRRTFLAGVFAALAAGALVVGLVWQSERLLRERARFAATAAHELRTPLAGLQLYGEMLAENRGNPANAQSYARRIAEEAERLGRIVANVLEFSRLRGGRPVVQSRPDDLADAARASLARLRPALESRGAQLSLRVRDPLPRGRFDRDALHQILQNLLDNAERYSRGSSDRTIRVEVEDGGSGPVLSVVDRGPGIRPSARRRLFRAFARDPDAETPGGLGIGLTLVLALARAQGARVSHAAEPGGGTRFSIAFSGCAEPAAAREVGAAPETGPGL